MNTFERSTREDWFTRMVRHLGCKTSLSAPSAALDIVSDSIETLYTDPESCTNGLPPHDFDLTSPLVHNDREHCYRCTKCGAMMRTVWRDQPGFWSVFFGRRA